jgi:predicted deacylase
MLQAEASVPLFDQIALTGIEHGPHLLITGGVHGDEFEPMAAIRRLAIELPGSLRRGRVTLVPVVNVAAFRRGLRTAEDGLDLARTCPGRSDGSITERVAAELSALIRTADAYVDLHTGGTRLQVLPLAGYMLHPDPQVLAASRRLARWFNLPMIWGTEPGPNGRSLSVARDARIPSIYCEYLGGGQTDPVGIAAYVEGCRNIMSGLGLIDRPLPALGAPLIVEDPRAASGHMQINHPTPAAGYFTPAVTLGQPVAKGDLLGTVCNATGSELHPIHARYGGLVIVLHTFSRIDPETSVAVVLEAEQGSQLLQQSPQTTMWVNDFLPGA